MKKTIILLFVLSVLLFAFSGCGTKMNEEFELKVKIEGKGSVEPNSGMFLKGEIIAFDINPGKDWEFSHWGGASMGDVLRAGNGWRVLMDGKKDLTAIFTEIVKDAKYKLVITTEGEGKVVPNLDYYLEGQSVTIDVQPAQGWLFSEWQGASMADVRKDGDKWQITMNGDKYLTAIFREEYADYYTLAAKVLGQGTVTCEPAKKYYEPRTLVEVTATPAIGWLFVGWQGDADGSEDVIEIVMDGNKEIITVFEAMRYSLQVNVVGQGIVEQECINDPTIDYVHDSLIELLAVPADGWYFKEWQGDVVGLEPQMVLEMDGDKLVTAVFAEISYNIAIEVVGDGEVGERLLNGKLLDGGYVVNSLVELFAQPAAGWLFQEWQGDVESSENTIEILMDADKFFTVIFAEIEYRDLELQVIGEGQIQRDPELDRYELGSLVTLTALPAEGWEFVEWQGDVEDTAITVQVEMDSDKTITAVFKEEIRHQVSVIVKGEGSITKSPDADEYKEGTIVVFTAVPEKGWKFARWCGDIVSTDTTIEFEVLAEMKINAIFEKKARYNLSTAVNGDGYIIREPDQVNYEEGTLIRLVANSAKGWNPNCYWMVNGVEYLSSVIEFKINQDTIAEVFFNDFNDNE